MLIMVSPVTSADPTLALSDASLDDVRDLLGRAAASHRIGRGTAPSYDRRAVRRAIVHIGVGGFHRAHLATYVDELCAAGIGDWAIVGAGVLRSDEAMLGVLRSQDGLYSLRILISPPAQAVHQACGGSRPWYRTCDQPSVRECCRSGRRY